MKNPLIKPRSAPLCGLLGGILSLLLVTIAPASAGSHTDLSDRLRQRLEAQRAGIPLTADGRQLQAVSTIQDFYARRVYVNFRPDVYGRDERLADALYN